MRSLRTDDFDYTLPSELIAQSPLAERSASRLLVLDRASGAVAHDRFSHLPDLLRPNDTLVVNDSRVIPARLQGRKSTGGNVELLLVRPVDAQRWAVMTRPGLRPGTVVRFAEALEAVIATERFEGFIVATFDRRGADLEAVIQAIGEVPTPPYVRQKLADPARYQTVYARERGSVAAPTAGLHFTPELLDALRARGISIVRITLHVGPGTFLPVKTATATDHVMHAERVRIDAAAADQVNMARAQGSRVIAVGTTSVRALESAADEDGIVRKYDAETSLFIVPGYRFRTVDAMITNFHLPKSTLLMLVCAFAGRDRVLAAYQEAVRQRYRFYSFGDCCLML